MDLGLHNCVTTIQRGIARRIPYINGGGCGWFTYFIGLELKRRKIPFEIVSLVFEDDADRIKDSKREINNYFNNKENYLGETAGAHHLIRVGDNIFDAMHTADKDASEILQYYSGNGYNLDLAEETMTLQEMHVALGFGLWNDSYDIRNNRKLQVLIKEVLKNYKPNDRTNIN